MNSVQQLPKIWSVRPVEGLLCIKWEMGHRLVPSLGNIHEFYRQSSIIIHLPVFNEAQPLTRDKVGQICWSLIPSIDVNIFVSQFRRAIGLYDLQSIWVLSGFRRRIRYEPNTVSVTALDVKKQLKTLVRGLTKRET